MVEKTLPSEVEKGEDFWITIGIHASDGRMKEYCEKNGCLVPEDTGEEDLPDVETEGLRKIDEEALKTGYLAGKWSLKEKKDDVDDTWKTILELAEEKQIWGAQVATEWGRKKRQMRDFQIMVYTPNYIDKEDVFRVRELLEEECGVDREIKYKPDIYSMLQVNKFNLGSMDIPTEHRYQG